MNITLQEFISWVIVGALAGSLAGMLVTMRKKGFGTTTNIGIGMGGAVIGGLFLNIFRINLGLGELRINLNALVAAVFGSLVLLLVVWTLKRLRKGKKSA